LFRFSWCICVKLICFLTVQWWGKTFSHDSCLQTWQKWPKQHLSICVLCKHTVVLKRNPYNNTRLFKKVSMFIRKFAALLLTFIIIYLNNMS
jgi:hypothetical protein